MTDIDRISNKIKESGLKQYKVANDIGIHPMSLSRILRGERNLTNSMKIRLFTRLNILEKD